MIKFLNNSTLIIGAMIGFLTLILFTACATAQMTQQITEINKSNTEIISAINIADYVDSCSFITLETTPNSLIREIKDLQIVDNKIYILNSVLGNNEVLVFDRTGRFLNRIGTKGNGPNEYLSISAFSVNSYKKYIVLFDSNKQKIHKYDYSGIFLESNPIKNECGLIIKSRFISKNRMLCVNGVNFRTSTIIFECDEDLGNIDVLSTTELHCNGVYEYAKNPIAVQSKYYFNPLSNIVYTYENKETVPVFKVDLNVKDYKPEKEIVKGDDYGKFFLKSLQKGFFPLSGIFESNNYILFIQNGFFTIWDKKESYGVSSVCKLSSCTSELLPMSPCSVVHVDGSEFVCVLSSSDIAVIGNMYNTQKITANAKITKLLKEQNSEDNPTIVFYTMK